MNLYVVSTSISPYQIDENQAPHEEKPRKGVEVLGSAKELPIVKPKPKTKPRHIRVAQSDQIDTPSAESPVSMVCIY